MDEMDDALREWGRHWREEQSKVGPITLSTARQPLGPSLRADWSPAPILVAIGLIAVAWFGITQLGAGNANKPLGVGQSVSGSGWLIEALDGRSQLCLGGLSRDTGGPTCSVVSVDVTNTDFATIPGAKLADGRWYARNVTVSGTWTGSSVTAAAVTTPASGPTDPPNPCTGDEGDGLGIGTPAEESQLAALDEEVFGHPETYAGLWRASSRDGRTRLVVNVVGDASAVTGKLRSLYPFPMCIRQVPYSEAVLNETLGSIGEQTANWLASVDFSTDRVRVSVATVTADIIDRLKPFADRVMLSPLIRPA